MIKQLNIFLISTLLLGQLSTVFAQKSKPIILSEPKDWKYEKIDFPLDFAPEISYKGFEELRFAPGMFDTISPTYFTYVFAVSTNNKTKLTKGEVKEFLSMYYKGLCDAVAKSKKMSIDTSKIKVAIKKVKHKSQNYTAQVVFFDTFNTGQKVLLNMELEITKNEDAKKCYILALVSPQSQQSDIWKKLYKIREKVRPAINHKN